MSLFVDPLSLGSFFSFFPGSSTSSSLLVNIVGASDFSGNLTASQKIQALQTAEASKNPFNQVQNDTINNLTEDASADAVEDASANASRLISTTL